jgi:hypothetical protein
MRTVLGLVVLLALAGCGGDKTVTVGEPGERGVYVDSIQKARDVADKANIRVERNEQTLKDSQ